MPKVSIIVSVYNTAIYLENCLSSIVNQSLKDIEIICVDDHSSDNSVQIIERYSSSDSRIVTVRHEKNCGLLRTRGDGVKASSGEYIVFLDSDDSLEPEACEQLSILMDKTGCDVIQFGTNVVPHGNVDSSLTSHYIHFLKPCKRKLSGDNIFEYQYGGTADWHLWNKIYRSEICKKAYQTARNQYMIVSDDLYISFFIMYYAKKMEGVSKKYYNYNIGRGYTNSDNTKINQIRVISDNSWFILDCIDFLKKEGKYEKYRKYCFREPLLQLGACVSLMKTIEDEETKCEAIRIIKESWSNELYTELVEKMIEDDKWNSLRGRLKRHIDDFGLIRTIKMIIHVISFNVKKKITQFFI